MSLTHILSILILKNIAYRRTKDQQTKTIKVYQSLCLGLFGLFLINKVRKKF